MRRQITRIRPALFWVAGLMSLIIASGAPHKILTLNGLFG
jgi:hypothetical protein